MASKTGAAQPADDDAWARRHPARALAEQQLRRQQRAIRKGFGRNEAAAGTPETRFHASHTQQGALARMFMAGHIDADQLASSAEIAAIGERIASDVRIRTVSLETRVDTSGMFGERVFETLAAVRHEQAYGTWRATLPNPGVVLAMIVDDLGVRAAAQRWRMRDAKARRLLIEALDAWPGHIAHAVRTIEDAEVAAAQAGLI